MGNSSNAPPRPCSWEHSTPLFTPSSCHHGCHETMRPHRECFLPQKQLSHPSQQVVHTQLNLRLTHWMCPTQVGGWPNRPLHPRASFPIWFSMWLWGREGCRHSSEQTQSDKVNSGSAADIFTPKFCSEGLGEFALSPSIFWDSGAPQLLTTEKSLKWNRFSELPVLYCV